MAAQPHGLAIRSFRRVGIEELVGRGGRMGHIGVPRIGQVELVTAECGIRGRPEF